MVLAALEPEPVVAPEPEAVASELALWEQELEQVSKLRVVVASEQVSPELEPASRAALQAQAWLAARGPLELQVR